MFRWVIGILLLLCGADESLAQSERAIARKGNQAYEEARYEDAEAKYREALEANPQLPETHFNLGDALYQQEKYEDAISHYKQSAELTDDPELRGKAFHNIGNSLLDQQQPEAAIKAYKQALRHRPGDFDTKYNLAYAQDLLRRQEEEQEQENKEEEEEEERENEEEESEEEQEDSGEEEEAESTEDKEEANQEDSGDNDAQDQEEGGQEKQPQEYMSPEEVERLLNALEHEEQKIHERLLEKKNEGREVKIEKDW